MLTYDKKGISFRTYKELVTIPATKNLFKGVVVVAIPKSELAYYRFSASLLQSLSEEIATAKRTHNKLSKLVSDQLSPFPLNVK